MVEVDPFHQKTWADRTIDAYSTGDETAIQLNFELCCGAALTNGLFSNKSALRSFLRQYRVGYSLISREGMVAVAAMLDTHLSGPRMPGKSSWGMQHE